MVGITLGTEAIKHVIALSDNNPKVIEYFDRKIKSAIAKKAHKAKRKLAASQKKKAKLVEVAEKFRADLIEKQTKAEIIFKKILKDLDIKYEFQKIIYTDTSFYIVDFYLPDYSFVLEIDGKQHSNKKNRSTDSRRTQVLKESGILKVYRFKNQDVYMPEKSIKKLKRVLKLI